MNFIDVILIILMLFFVIGGIVFLVMGVMDDEIEAGIGVLLVALFFVGLCMLPFVKLDRGSGNTVGIITSVDKNFFGTTAVYIKTSETEQEKYCIEFDEKLENKAKELIDKKVKISYGERVGLYSTGKCSQAPIEKIELVDLE